LSNYEFAIIGMAVACQGKTLQLATSLASAP
jgi:hypothetical protein